MALIELDQQLIGQDFGIVHILHDEVILAAREDIVDVVAVTVKSCMDQAFKGILLDVPMVVELCSYLRYLFSKIPSAQNKVDFLDLLPNRIDQTIIDAP